MGSLGEEELSQMVRDFIESDTSSPISPTPTEPNSSKCGLTLQEILGLVTAGESEVLELVLECMRNMASVGETATSMKLKKKMILTKLRRKNYDASLCQITAEPHSKMKRLRGKHEYIDVMMKKDGVGEGATTRLIVDIEFKSQFELARPTEAYRELLENVPSIFVGSEEKLHKLISLLCTAAELSLKESGLHIPPWRKASYLHSKWLSVPPNSTDSAQLTPHHHQLYTEDQGNRTNVAGGGRGGGDSSMSTLFSIMGINCC